MTPQQALDTMNNACRQLAGTAKDHEVLASCYRIVAETLKKPVPQEKAHGKKGG